MKFIVLLFGLILLSFGSQAEKSSIGYDSVLEALLALKENPSTQVGYSDGWTVVTLEEKGNHVLWSFTPESHQAHPTAVRREVVEKNGQIFIEMSALCQSTKPECDHLISEFEKLNDDIRKSIQSKNKANKAK